MRKRPAPRLSDVPKDRLISIGGPVDKIYITLRFFGDDLQPQEITKVLGCSPTSCRRKGEKIADKRYIRIASTGNWLLKVRQQKHSSLEDQIKRLLAMVTNDINVWVNLTSKYSADVFCGLFLNEWNRMTDLSAHLIAELAARRLTLRFDIYGSGPLGKQRVRRSTAQQGAAADRPPGGR